MTKREMMKRVREINARFKEMADTLEAEKRQMTQDEIDEKNALTAEKAVLELRMAQADQPRTEQTVQRESRGRVFDEAVRFMRNGRFRRKPVRW